jgi:hypothetical protein
MATSLYLDDNRTTPEGWKRAHNAEEAKVRLLSGPVDHMSFDFDLDNPDCETCNFACGLREGGCQHGCGCHDAGDENGLDLLQWMKDQRIWPRNYPQVHSHNLLGSLKMKHFIRQNYPGRAPGAP